MKLTLYMYVAQPKKGHYEVSMPWVAQLAEPLRGPSPAQLKEELMFRLLELVHGGMSPADLDRLIAPDQPYLTSVYLELMRQVEEDRPPVRLTATTHVVVGAWKHDDLTRVWLPKIPGLCLALKKVDHMYASVNQWVREYAETAQLEKLDGLQCSYVASIESMELDLGYPAPLPTEEDRGLPGGRLTRPNNLHQVATNLSHRAEDSLLPQAYGRDEIIDELVEVLMSPTPTNVCLVGPPGVGKTALMHEAARRVWGMSKAYQERRDVWQTSGDRIIAGMSIIGQWEKRTEAICDELAERADYLFAEDLLGLVRAGRTYQGESSVARFIEPYLEQERFGIVTEATRETFALARSSSPGFVDKFRRIQVPELSYQESLSVVSELIRHLEGLHEIRFTADSVETLLHLARRFYKQEAFPGKAVRLVKQCQYHALRLGHEEEDFTSDEVRITPDVVAEVVHRQTGLPMTILRPGTGRKPREIKSQFQARVFGQPDAIEAVTSLVLAIEQGLTDPDKPMGSFLLIGPSGVGKTETAKALAFDLFGSAERMNRFDMSEFSESVSLSRLIGTAREPDGELTSKVRLQPFCVLLFDEIEKAHPLVLDLLLQVLGDGRLTDAAGRIVDFRNTVVLMTSNLGAGSEDRWLGFQDSSVSDRHLHYFRAAEQFFRPEIFNRIDKVIPYRPLGPDALRRIARRTLQNLLDRRGLRQAQVMVDVDEGLIDFLAQSSVDRRYGARTLAHRIERQLITPLANRLSQHRPEVGLTRVILTPADDGVALDLESLERAPSQHIRGMADEVEVEAQAIVEALNQVAADVEALMADPRRELVEEEYAGILEELNTTASEGGWTGPLAEKLHQREGFLNRMNNLERRVQGLLDPRGTGEFLFTLKPDETKAKLHKIAGITRDLKRQLVWLQSQLEELAENSQGATLVVFGLSGPYVQHLETWRQWIAALGESLDLDLAFGFRTDSGWRKDPPKSERITAFAASSETPGVAPAFDLLSGYLWSPKAPSEGQHALLVANAHRFGSIEAETLLDWLREEEPQRNHDAQIEFIESEGQLEDLRLDMKFPIPEDRGSNLAEFMTRILTTRMVASRSTT